jgi:hypothetical protein
MIVRRSGNVQGKGKITSENNLSHHSTVHLSDLLTSETIELRGFRKLAGSRGEGRARLIEVGAIEPHFIRSMKEIIFEFGPYMVMWPGVVLHASDGVRQLCMGLEAWRTQSVLGIKMTRSTWPLFWESDNHSHVRRPGTESHDADDAKSAIQNTCINPWSCTDFTIFK